MKDIIQPIIRKKLRQVLGKEFFILKRVSNWHFSKTIWAKKRDNNWENSVYKHKSIILRQLKDVEMYLQENKRTNLNLAIKHIDKVVINPGETFSIWKLVGRPTKRKGYLDGLVLNQGKIDKGTGGGLCQLGNLLFWIFAHSPLTIVERHRHRFDVFPDVNRNVPFGAGATLSYNYIDLQVKNETKESFQINLWLDNTHLFGELLSENKLDMDYRIEERNHIIMQQNWGCYSRHNQIYKIETDKNGKSQESFLIENNALLMYSPFLGE